MSAKSWRAMYDSLIRRRATVPLEDVDERTKIQEELDRIAPKIDQLIMLPNKRCSECGAQMISSMRKPWWWCISDPGHWSVKKTFRPDPELTFLEWQEIGPKLAEAADFIVVPIGCAVCGEQVFEEGVPYLGYKRSIGAQNVYLFDALLIHLGIDPEMNNGSARGRRLKGPGSWSMMCQRCRTAAIE